MLSFDWTVGERCSITAANNKLYHIFLLIFQAAVFCFINFKKEKQEGLVEETPVYSWYNLMITETNITNELKLNND